MATVDSQFVVDVAGAVVPLPAGLLIITAGADKPFKQMDSAALRRILTIITDFGAGEPGKPHKGRRHSELPPPPPPIVDLNPIVSKV